MSDMNNSVTKQAAPKEMIKAYRELDDDYLKAFWEAGGCLEGVEYPLADTFLHTHTDLGSPKDSVLTISQYLNTASAMGASSVSVTDHGTMYGLIPMYKALGDYNAGKADEDKIKLIFGVEFYVCNTFDTSVKKKQTRLHLIAYAKDEIGYHILCRLTTASNRHIIKVGDNQYPCLSKEDLEKYLAPGTQGHGHVILTSACIGGVVAGIMYESDNEKVNADEFARQIKALQDLSQSYQMQNQRISELTKLKDDTQTLTKKTYTKRLNILKKNPDDAALAQLQKEMKESEEAKKALPKMRAMLKASQGGLSAIKKEIEKLIAKTSGNTLEERISTKLSDLKEAYDFSMQNVIPADQVEEVFTKEMLYYKELAGDGNWFVELQYHGIENEKKYMHVLASLAEKNDIPVVAANDAHMATREQTNARKIVNALRFSATWEEASEDEYELYLKTDAELYKWLCKELPKETAFKAMKNRRLITDACNVTLSKEKHYPVYIQNKESA